MNQRTICRSLAVIFFMSTPVMAETSRHHAAHVHGAGQLNLAVEGKLLHIEMTIPGHDIVGFESITSPEREQQVDQAIERLQQASMWHLPTSAQCTLLSTKAGHSAESHHDDDHGHHHDHGSHLDFTVSQVFECNNPKALTEIEARLFERFANSESLKVQALTDKGQMSATLKRGKPVFRF
ncbi:DUF2796 domain-containing protein [Kistimonas scapharcae]|uniref:DUF2796 domain-containing protein n=1 Tax=Kistimonas scapharcae TaxID=1036133 RepID=A0ABP8V897_9GAMM